MDTPVTIAEEILQLASSSFSTSPPVKDEQHDLFAIYNAKIRMQGLCDKLLQTVLGRLEYTAVLAESYLESSALGFVTTLGVADAIGDGTASLTNLSETLDVNPQYLGISMDCLSKLNYFEEVGGFGARVYKNNHLSDILRADHPESLKDAIGFVCDEGFKSAAYLLPASKPDSQATGANIAFNFSGSIFKWMADADWRGRRMGSAMQQLHRMANENVASDYPWNKLVSPIIDIGGGIGSLEMALLKYQENDALRFTIFDIPATIENAKKTWESQPPAASCRVSFSSGDFLAPTLAETGIPCGQPTYIIRHVSHDWPDDEVIAILRNVRAAMLKDVEKETSPKLLLCDMLLRDSSARSVRTTSMRLLALGGGITRTETEILTLLEKSGFKVEKVYFMRAIDSIVEASPV